MSVSRHLHAAPARLRLRLRRINATPIDDRASYRVLHGLARGGTPESQCGTHDAPVVIAGRVTHHDHAQRIVGADAHVSPEAGAATEMFDIARAQCAIRAFAEPAESHLEL